MATPAAYEVISTMRQRNIIALALLAGLLGACGDNSNSGGQGSTTSSADTPAAPSAPPPAAAAPAPAPAAAPAMAAAGADEHGKSVYNRTCALCHAAGVAGAPIPGIQDDWTARIEQGKDVLYQHAIDGYTGEKGMMPPRGGNPALGDDEIKAAVDYMVGKPG